jgi:hypothetical protein
MLIPSLSALSAVLLLVGCIETGTSPTGVSGQAKYRKIAVVPYMTQDVLSVHYNKALGDPIKTEGKIDWDVTGATGRTAKQVLAEAGAQAQVTGSPSTAAAKNTDAVVTLLQAPLDWISTTYDPGRDFLLQGLLGVAAGAQTKNQRYKPRVVATLMLPEKQEFLGKSACAVGVKVVVTDPATGEVVNEGRAISSIRELAEPIHGVSWDQVSKSDRRLMIAHCESALRSAVIKALADAKVIQ